MAKALRNNSFSRWDGFRWVLAGIFILQSIIIIIFVGRFQNQLQVARHLNLAVTTSQPKIGDYVYLDGKVVAGRLHTDKPDFDQKIREVLHIPEPLSFSGVFTHSEKRGKNSHTITDLIINGTRDFIVDTAAGKIRLKRSPDIIYSEHTARPGISPFQKFSHRSTSLRVTYFAPRHLYLTGVVNHKRDEEIVLTGGMSSNNKPLITSEVPRDRMVTQARFASLLTGLAILLFLVTMLVPWRRSIREQVARVPAAFYIFDITGGPEQWALLLFALYGVGSIMIMFGFGSDHQFVYEQLQAVLFAGLCMLVYLGRTAEYFYVADKRDGYLYEYSRGFFSLSRTRMALLNDLKLYIEVRTGSKGAKHYSLKAKTSKGKVMDIGGTGSSESTLLEIKGEFETFRKHPFNQPAGTGMFE